MGKKAIRTLLMASMTIMLCMAMVVGGTYALWSQSVKIENHLVAGELKVKLERTDLTKHVLDATTGYMTDINDSTDVDLTSGATVNVFGIEEDEKIVPTSSYTATLKLTNEGTVAVKYDIVIKLTSVSNELAQQLMVSIDGGTPKALSALNAEGESIVSSDIAKGGEPKTFTVTIAFANDADTTGITNNDAMNKEAQFDLIVKAVQATTATT